MSAYQQKRGEESLGSVYHSQCIVIRYSRLKSAIKLADTFYITSTVAYLARFRDTAI